jgi:hypothetical protein
MKSVNNQSKSGMEACYPSSLSDELACSGNSLVSSD